MSEFHRAYFWIKVQEQDILNDFLAPSAVGKILLPEEHKDPCKFCGKSPAVHENERHHYAR